MERTFDIGHHLEKVSRSFAFCIKRLDEPLRTQIGLSYLLCRILDTAEDSAWQGENGQAQQLEALEQFVVLLRSEPSRSEIEAWVDFVKAGSKIESEDEVALLTDAHFVFKSLWQESPEVRATIFPAVISMARGMREFVHLRHFDEAGRLKLASISEVNRYCFFVAGVVGEVLTGLVALHAKERGIAVTTKLADAFRFGLFLQKVNLLKDQKKDLLEGRDLVPSRRAVLRSAIDDSRQAIAYLLSMPVEVESYRLFCAWSLFLGLASLPRALRGEKIGRIETFALLAKVEIKIRSNDDLLALFDRYQEALALIVDDVTDEIIPATAHLGVDSYRALYEGIATDRDLDTIAELI